MFTVCQPQGLQEAYCILGDVDSKEQITKECDGKNEKVLIFIEHLLSFKCFSIMLNLNFTKT